MGVSDSSNKNLRVYPVPASTQITVEYDHHIKSVQIYSAAGREIKRQSANAMKLTVDVSYYPQGSYIMRIITEDGVKTVKFIKK